MRPARRTEGMNGSPGPTPMHRKIAASGTRAEPGSMAAGAAFERALALAGERLAQVPVTMVSLAEVERTGAEIVDTLPDQPLITLTEGPEGAAGLVILQADAVGCLVELLTTGRLTDRPPPARRPTRTDAALVAEFLDLALDVAGAALDTAPAAVWVAGFRTAGHLPDPRPLGLMLDEPGYRLVRCKLGFGPPSPAGEPARTGEMTFVFPAAGRGRVQAPPPPAPSEEAPILADLPHGPWPDRLEQAVAAAPVRLGAVLARVSLPLSAILGLAPGMLLPVPRSSVHSVQLEGSDGSLVCFARLGQGNGHRALRLDLAAPGEEPPLPLPVIEGQALAANPPPPLKPLPEIPEAVAQAVAAEARLQEQTADRVMEEAMARPAEAG